MPTLSKKELDSIIDEVANALNGAVTVEAAKLSKAHDGESTASETPTDTSATTPPSTDSASPDASASAPPTDDASASAPPADASAAPPGDALAPPPGADGAAPGPDASASPDAGGQGADPRELEEAYTALPIEELKMHYLACKTALVAAMGNGGSADAAPAPGAPGPDGAPPADAGAAPTDPAASAPALDAGPPAGAPAPATPPGDPSASAGGPPTDDPSAALKTEMGTELPSDKKANGENPLHAVKKTEQEKAVEALSKAQPDLIANLTKAVKNFVERPARLAITSTADLKKSDSADKPFEQLSKSEIDAKLKVAIRRTDLKKSDRETINSYALGLVKAESIKHLI